MLFLTFIGNMFLPNQYVLNALLGLLFTVFSAFVSHTYVPHFFNHTNIIFLALIRSCFKHVKMAYMAHTHGVVTSQ